MLQHVFFYFLCVYLHVRAHGQMNTLYFNQRNVQKVGPLIHPRTVPQPARSSGVEREHALVVSSDQQRRWKVTCQDVQPGHIEIIRDRVFASDGEAPAGDCRYREQVRGWLGGPSTLKQVTLTQRSSWPCWSLPEAAHLVGSGGWSGKQQRTWATPDQQRGIYCF